jgi:hypothetical protein
MKQLSIRVIVALAFAAATIAGAAPAFAQGGGVTASISGTVVDASGAVLPGADVKIVNDATRAEFTAVSGPQGLFTVPSVDPGTYTVTVTLMSFKTVTLKGVVVNAGVPASVKATMEVGDLAETVVVQGGSDIVQTQTAAVSTTLDVNQISKLPLTTRHLLNFVTTMPGVNTPGGVRASTVNGLPQSTINITIDGMSAQDNHLKGVNGSDGFFARVSPRLDAMEELTVSTAAQDASSTSQGAVQIRFTTRSGSNQFTGSGYYYLQHYKLNANTWFSNRDLPPDPATGKAPKAEDVLHQPGARVGGPIVIPGLFDGRDKAFFFVNYEQSRSPGQALRNRTVLHPNALNGTFRYDIGGGQVREVNVLTVAQANGQVATIDPVVGKVLADIRTASQSTGSLSNLTNPLHQQFAHQIETKGVTKYPTWRVDYNLSQKHKLSASMNYTDLLSTPDTTNTREPVFPGFPGFGNQHSDRYTVQGTLRSTFTPNIVNELRIGRTGGATLFSPELGPQQFGGTSVADQGGYWLGLSAAGINNASNSSNYSAREAGTRVFENTLSWIRGTHSLSMGGGYTRAVVWLENKQFVPHLTFGVVNGDPAAAMFTTANFPGASGTQLTAAQNYYATITARVNAINATTRLNESTDTYEYLGQSLQRARLDDYGFFIADTWRWKPNVTINLGLRYELQMPFSAENNSYSTTYMADICGVSGIASGGACNVFQPGTLGGQATRFYEFKKGEKAYGIDKNNFAPSLGINWVPGTKPGVLGSLLGQDGDSSFRAGYAIAYSRPGMSDFTGVYGSNPGVSITTNRTLALGNLNQDNQGYPVLLRQGSRLGPPPFQSTRQYPMTGEVTGSVNAFDSNLQVPYSQTWTAGWQRRLTRDLVGEIRYVGTRYLQDWIVYDYNELNIVENGFLDEFRLAQGNLQANIAAGRGSTFAYTGIPGTQPLPIFLAYFTGLGKSQAGNTASYTGTLWTNNTFVNPLARFDPQPDTAANALDADAQRRQNALNAGLSSNFLVANPEALGGANLTGNGGYTKFNGIQTELRKRLSGGLSVQGNYSYGKGYASTRFSFRYPREKRQDTGTEGNVVHAFKMNWTYELPFGQGRRYGGNAGGALDRLIGGWSIDGIGRIQSGTLLNLGNVRLVGMTRQDVEKMFKLRFDDANRVVYMLPQDVIDETVKAFSVSATSLSGYGQLGAPSGRYFAPANGPDCIEIADGKGDCGTGDLVVSGPRQVRFDISATKRTRVAGRVTAEVRAEMINAFNHPWFNTVGGIGNDPDDYRVDGVGENSSRIIQIVTRISW